MLFTSTIFNTLKKTLSGIVDDPTDGLEAKAIYKQFLDVGPMADHYEDELEGAGPGLAAAFVEGQEIPEGQIMEGFLKRYMATKFGLKLNISDEAIEDTKFPQIIKAAGRLKRAMWKTVDVESALLLARGFNASYVGGDGVSMWNAAHPLAGGGTESNLMATPLSPSVQALVVARAQLEQMKGHDGVIEGYMMEKIICPSDQRGDWEVILGSSYHPDPGEFNAINVANRKMDLSLCVNRYWNTTTTNWAAKTDADDGMKFKWRRRPRSRSWPENDFESMKYSISARWSIGWTDWRGTYGVNA